MLKFAFSVCVGTWCAPSSVLVTTDCGPVLSSPRHLSNWAVTAPPLTATTHNLGRRQLVNIFHFIINNSSSPTLGHLPLVPHSCVKEGPRWRCRWWWRLLWLDINTSTCQLRRISLHWLLLVLSKPPTVYIMSEHQTWSSLPPHTQHRAAPLMLSLTRGGSSMFCLQAVQSLPDLTSQGRHNKWKNSDFFFTVFLHQWNYRYNKQQHPIWKIQN